MRQIYKKNSLEDCISRLPGILPALNKEWVINYGNLYKKYETYNDAYEVALHGSIDFSNIEEKITFKDYSDNKILSSNTNGNYGLIVSDIEIPKRFINTISDFTDININIEIPIDEDYDNEYYYLINQISTKSLRNLKEKCERTFYDNNSLKKTKGKYYFIYKRNIYSIELTDDLWSQTIDEVVSKSTLHKFLTYRTLKKWYDFFNQYYLLLSSGKGKINYKDALEYYNYESEVKTEEKRNLYKEYDELFKSRGGKEFYEWICLNCIPKFYINDFKGSGDTFFADVENYWGCKYLYYPEAIKWASWFYNRSIKYKNYKDVTDCLNSDECCDCTEFFKRGGHKMSKKLNTWITSISSEKVSTNSATLTFQISLSTSIDDIGEMFIFSNEYKESTDYSSKLKTDNKLENFTGGTVIHRPIITDEETGNVFIDENTYMIKDGNNVGFVQNKYKENVFDRNQWVDYTSYYINKYPDEFVTNSMYYSFNRKNEIIFNPNDRKMVEKYKVELGENGLINIEGVIYPIIKKKYVRYYGNDNSLLNGLLLPVDETADGRYFTSINGRTFFAIKRYDGYFYFNFKTPTKCSNENEYNCRIEPIGDEKVETITYRNTLYLLKDNFVEVETNGIRHKYPKLNGYVNIDNEIYYISGRSVVTFDNVEYNDNDIPFDTYKIDNKNWIVNNAYPMVRNGFAEILYPYETYRCDLVSGVSESKLSLLRQKMVLTDDFGNEMPGYFNYTKNNDKEQLFSNKFNELNRGNSKYSQPYNGCQLDLLYKVGNVSDLSKNEHLTIENSEDNQYFDGNILQSMRFFFTVDGVPYKDGEVLLTNDMETEVKTNVLGAIKKCSDNVVEYVNKLYEKEIENAIVKGDNLVESKTQSEFSYLDVTYYDLKLFCEFTYNIGAILKQKTIKKNGLINYDGFILAHNMHSGVQYKETDELVNKTCIYSLANGNKMFLKYFDIIQNYKSVILNSYNNQNANVSIANFVFPIRIFKKNKDNENEVSQNEYENEYGFSQFNNLIAAPVFRKEYTFGISMPQNLNSDIYIDRGICKAFDKHLRLQEIKTMDALEQYQNGAIFNIID